MTPPPPRRTKDAEDEQKPGCTPVRQESIGLALQKAVREAGPHEVKRVGRKDKSELWNELNALSQYAREKYVDDCQRIRKTKGSDEEKEAALNRIEDYYWQVVGSPVKMEVYLEAECIPELEKKAEALKTSYETGIIPVGQYDKELKRTQKDIVIARLDARQLKALREIRDLSAKLEHELGYHYLPNTLMHDTMENMAYIRTARKRGRDDTVAEMEARVKEFQGIVSSPSKAQEYLMMKKETAPPELGKMIIGDLERAAQLVMDAAPQEVKFRKGTRCRFRIGEFEAISDSTGSSVTRMVHEDGTQVAFLDGKEVRVTNIVGESAVYRGGKLAQISDRKGNLLQFENGSIVRAMDSKGYILDLNPKEPCPIMDNEGNVVIFKKEHAEFLKHLNPIIKDFVSAQALGGDSTGFHFERVVERAAKCLPLAEKKLAELTEKVSRRPVRMPTETARIKNMAYKLNGAGVLGLPVKPSEVEFQAKLNLYGREFDAWVLSASSVDMLRKKLVLNHPAHAFSSLENTLIVRLDAMMFEGEAATERPEQYARVFTVKAKDGTYATILALHTKMLDAIKNNSFAGIGRHEYERELKALNRDNYFVAFKLSVMRNCEMCRAIADMHGEDYLDALGRKNYGALGRRVVFDSLIRGVTRTYTRPRTRQARDSEVQAIGITDGDIKLADEYVALRFRGKNKQGERAKEMLAMIMGAYGIDVPTDLGALDKDVNAARAKFFLNPSEASYLDYLKVDFFRDRVRKAGDELKTFLARARGARPSLPVSPQRFYEGRRAFAKLMEQQLIYAKYGAVDDGLALAMQRSRYRSEDAPPVAPTAFSTSIRLQAIAKEIGYEALFNEVCADETPWGLMRRAYQLRDISRGYQDWEFIKVKARAKLDEEQEKAFKKYLEAIKEGADLGKTISGVP